MIDRCNFRCTYCMPEEEYARHYQFLKKEEWLSFGEILRVTKLFLEIGVNKVRLTGGEPLLRPDLAELIQELSRFEQIDDLALTTNGSLLAPQAKTLKAAGLQRLTVSLDTLHDEIFRKMSGTRVPVAQVLKGIEEAQRVGFQDIKINVVVQKGINDHTILDLVRFFKGTGHILRFIEYMDVGNCNHWTSEFVVPSSELYRRINEVFPLRLIKPNYHGEVASRYQFEDGGGEIGFISSVTQPFCGSCTRARLSTDGKIYTCLFSGQGTDLRTPLRAGASDQELLAMIKDIWKKRDDRYSENRFLLSSRQEKPLKKVEMFQIGG